MNDVSDASTQLFTATVEGNCTRMLSARMDAEVERLSGARVWAVSPPFVLPSQPQEVTDSVEEHDSLGCALRIWGPGGSSSVSREMDLAALFDVTALIDGLRQFCSENEVDIRFEIDGVCVGWLTPFGEDMMLSEGLLKPWRSALGSP